MIFIVETLNSSSHENFGSNDAKIPTKKVILRPITDPNLPSPGNLINNSIDFPLKSEISPPITSPNTKNSQISNDAHLLASSSKELFDFMNKIH